MRVQFTRPLTRGGAAGIGQETQVVDLPDGTPIPEGGTLVDPTTPVTTWTPVTTGFFQGGARRIIVPSPVQSAAQKEEN